MPCHKAEEEIMTLNAVLIVLVFGLFVAGAIWLLQKLANFALAKSPARRPAPVVPDIDEPGKHCGKGILAEYAFNPLTMRKDVLAEVKKHLGACEQCRRSVVVMRITKQRMNKWKSSSIDDGPLL